MRDTISQSRMFLPTPALHTAIKKQKDSISQFNLSCLPCDLFEMQNSYLFLFSANKSILQFMFICVSFLLVQHGQLLLFFLCTIKHLTFSIIFLSLIFSFPDCTSCSFSYSLYIKRFQVPNYCFLPTSVLNCLQVYQTDVILH